MKALVITDFVAVGVATLLLFSSFWCLWSAAGYYERAINTVEERCAFSPPFPTQLIDFTEVEYDDVNTTDENRERLLSGGE